LDRYFVANAYGAIEGHGYATHREALGFLVEKMKGGWDVDSWHIVLEGSGVGRGDADQPNARTSIAKCASELRAHTNSNSPGESV